MEQLFLPYLYFPDADASYFKLVTPFGSVHLTYELIFKALMTLVTTIGGFFFYRWCFDVLKKRDDDDDDEEEEEEEEDEQAAQKKKKKMQPKRKLTKQEEACRSALEASIAKKGANSYYYAHQPRDTKDYEDKDGNKLIKSAVTTYGWTDKKERVCIYLTDGFLIDLPEECIQLEWTATSLSLDLVLDVDKKQAKSLVIPTLYEPITDASWKLKKNRLTITLTKQNPGQEWKSLNGAVKNLEDHVQYDPSLYD